MTSRVVDWLARVENEELTKFCFRFLERRGFVTGPGRGVDFLAQDDEGLRYVVEVKAGRSQLTSAALYQLAAQQKLHGADRALLVTTLSVPTRLAEEVLALEIELWDRNKLARMIEGDADVREIIAGPSDREQSPRPGHLWLRRLRIQGFRGIEELDLTLPERGPTVLAGINGAGKTTMLEAFAIGLHWLLVRLASPDGRGRTIHERDIHNRVQHCVITIEASIDGRPTEWSVTGSRKGTPHRRRSQLDELNTAVRSIQFELEHDRDRPLPVAVMYAVNRAVLDIPRRIRKRHDFDRFSAHAGALVHGGTRDFRLFFEWFRDREDLENEQRIKQPDHRDPQLVAVRQAIETLLEGVSNLRVRRNPQRMVVNKDGEELIVDQLSDGEKCLLAAVGDLARRLALANPASATPLHEHGVVLIDEIDLHLHPRWQRRVIPELERTFPNCQFVVTTHSPQVLSHVKGETIRLGRGEQGLTVLDRRSVYGWDTNRILEEFLEVDERPPEIKDGLDDYFRKIQTGQLEDAEQARRKLEDEIGPDEPSFKKADVLMRHRRLLAGE